MKRTAIVAILLSSLGAQGATYSFFTPTQTTNIVNALISAGTYGSTAFNNTQFSVVPYSSVAIKSGAALTNTSLTTPTLTTPTLITPLLTNSSLTGYIALPLTEGVAVVNSTNALGSITGSANYVAKWTLSGKSLVNSAIVDNGTNITLSLPPIVGVNGTPIYKILSATATLDFPTVTQHNSTNLTMTVTGASPTSTVTINVEGGGMEPFVFTGYVSATNTVTVRAINPHSSALDPASATYRATVINFN